jgi:hypothetical protein
VKGVEMKITTAIACLILAFCATADAQVPAGYKVVVIPTNATLGSLVTPQITAAMIAAAGGITNVIFSTPISTLTTGAVVTVTPSQSRRIYQVEASVPITLTNNLTALGANCTTNYEWETWINYTDTNALSTVWDSRIAWQQQTPDLTVTGQYRFAFSTACGTNISGRQIYPTVYPWVNPECVLLSANFNQYPITLTGAGANTNAFYCVKISKNSYEIFKFLLYGYGLTNAITLTNARRIFNIDHVYGSELSVPPNVATTYAPTKTLIIMSGTEAGDGFAGTTYNYGYAAGFRLRKPGPGDIYIQTSHRRPANELEINAYNAGWRP